MNNGLNANEVRKKVKELDSKLEKLSSDLEKKSGELLVATSEEIQNLGADLNSAKRFVEEAIYLLGQEKYMQSLRSAYRAENLLEDVKKRINKL